MPKTVDKSNLNVMTKYFEAFGAYNNSISFKMTKSKIQWPQ